MFLGQMNVKLDQILVENRAPGYVEQLKVFQLFDATNLGQSATWHVSAWELKHNVSWLIFQSSLCFFVCLVSCGKSGAEELVWKKQTHLPCQPLGALRSWKKMGQIHCEYILAGHCCNCLEWIQVSKVSCSFLLSSRTIWKKLCELDVHDCEMVCHGPNQNQTLMCSRTS